MYFITNKNKILYCILFLKNNVVMHQYLKTSNNTKLKSKIFKEFRKLLLNLIANSTNCRLLVYKR